MKIFAIRNDQTHYLKKIVYSSVFLVRSRLTFKNASDNIPPWPHSIAIPSSMQTVAIG